MENGAATSDNLRRESRVVEGMECIRVTQEDGGIYLTLSLDSLLRREQEAFGRACRAVAAQLRELAPALSGQASVLVIGLGNRAVTPDAIGPLCCQAVLATRHLIRTEPILHGFRPVSVLAPGVLGTTGVETGEIVRGLLDHIKPDLVLAVDALAARRMGRLMRTIQLTNTGIVPGSGVGNARTALTREELGVPVIAIGVPTVIDTATIAEEIAQHTGVQCEALEDLNTPAIVTTRDVDQQVADAARVIGYGINLFLHPMLALSDIDAFLS
jgi:spore protease